VDIVLALTGQEANPSGVEQQRGFTESEAFPI